jgi:hypothetical protein
MAIAVKREREREREIASTKMMRHKVYVPGVS